METKMFTLNSTQLQNPYMMQEAVKSPSHLQYGGNNASNTSHGQDQCSQPIQINQYDSPRTKCTKLEQINQNLKYNIVLLEAELQLLKKLQKEKSQQNRKIKQKINGKNQKFIEVKRHLHLQRDKLKKLFQGFKLLNQQVENLGKKEQNTRDKRLCAQQKKNQAHEQYQQLQKQYKNIIYNIRQRDGVIQQLNRLQEENEQISQEISQLQDLLNEEQTSRDDVVNLRKQRNNKVKQLNERVLQLQKQQNSLKSQINSIEQNLALWQNQKIKIEQKSQEQMKLFQKIQQSKNYLLSKRAEFAQVDSAYKQFCLQQTRIKKQIILQRECNEARRKYKQGLIKTGNKTASLSPKIRDQKKINKQKQRQKERERQNLRQKQQKKDTESIFQIQQSQINKLQMLAKRFQSLNNRHRK